MAVMAVFWCPAALCLEKSIHLSMSPGACYSFLDLLYISYINLDACLGIINMRTDNHTHTSLMGKIKVRCACPHLLPSSSISLRLDLDTERGSVISKFGSTLTEYFWSSRCGYLATFACVNCRMCSTLRRCPTSTTVKKQRRFIYILTWLTISGTSVGG